MNFELLVKVLFVKLTFNKLLNDNSPKYLNIFTFRRFAKMFHYRVY